MPIPPYDSHEIRRGVAKYNSDDAQIAPGEEKSDADDTAQRSSSGIAALADLTKLPPYERTFYEHPFWLHSNVEDRAKVASTMPIPVIGYISYQEFEALGGPN